MKFNSEDPIINWLLAGDVSIQFQVCRDLLGEHRSGLQARISTEGWGREFLKRRGSGGHWGESFYQPKWISTHYTLLDLRYLNLPPDNSSAREAVQLILDHEKAEDGGINPAATVAASDVCVNGMFLNYACYFGAPADELKSVVDFILTQLMPDGGFNCRLNRSGAEHSSLHSTLSMAEGIVAYRDNGYTYRLDELESARKSSEEFMLIHHLFRSDRTGEIIHPSFLKLAFPGRWRYDILKALDYWQSTGTPPDGRMTDAIDILLSKRNKYGTWNLQAYHPGKLHFKMEQAGKPSRWNTLRALRVLQWWQHSQKQHF